MGPFSPARIDGAADGMGEHGPATRSIVTSGFVQPDLVTGLTLFLLARQPRPDRRSGSAGSKPKASPIAGGVWVREQFTIHRPLPRTDPFQVTGESTGRYVRKGRRYGTTAARCHDSGGNLVATNLTTGLLAYRVEPGSVDGVEGQPLEDTPAPQPDQAAASANPHHETLRAALPGQRLGGHELEVTLAMMAARDTAQPDNPIHSDPEEAKRAGLAKPIAGGSHVLAFVIEPILDRFGSQALSHGAKFDVRWKAPTEADSVIVPTATVTAVDPEQVVFDLAVTLGSGSVAMVGTATVPLARNPGRTTSTNSGADAPSDR